MHRSFVVRPLNSCHGSSSAKKASIQSRHVRRLFPSVHRGTRPVGRTSSSILPLTTGLWRCGTNVFSPRKYYVHLTKLLSGWARLIKRTLNKRPIYCAFNASQGHPFPLLLRLGCSNSTAVMGKIYVLLPRRRFATGFSRNVVEEHIYCETFCSIMEKYSLDLGTPMAHLWTLESSRILRAVPEDPNNYCNIPLAIRDNFSWNFYEFRLNSILFWYSSRRSRFEFVYTLLFIPDIPRSENITARLSIFEGWFTQYRLYDVVKMQDSGPRQW